MIVPNKFLIVVLSKLCPVFFVFLCLLVFVHLKQ